jgi:hypothetical protein
LLISGCLLGLLFALAAFLRPPSVITLRRQAGLAGLTELVAVTLLLVGPVTFALGALLLFVL